jgi:hypothetical protein
MIVLRKFTKLMAFEVNIRIEIFKKNTIECVCRSLSRLRY